MAANASQSVPAQSSPDEFDLGASAPGAIDANDFDPDDFLWDRQAWHDCFEERAGIYEYDAGMSRAAAEEKALLSCKTAALEQLNRHRHLIGWPKDIQHTIALLTGQLRKIDAFLRAMGIPGA